MTMGQDLVEKLKQPQTTVACLGEVMIELSNAGDDLVKVGVAGDTYNSAVYLARLLDGVGPKVAYVTALGTDPYSDRILDQMRGHNIDGSFVERRADKMPGLYAIETDDEGERSFFYWRETAAARTLFAEPAEVTLEKLMDVSMLQISGISMAILPPGTREKIIAWLPSYRAAGGIFVYDSNYRPRLWEDVETARDVNMRMWSEADIALPSVDDEMALFGDKNEAEVLARLRDFGVQFGALKRGAEGPVDLSGDVTGASYPAVTKIIDTTAAGDSFNAGYLAALLKGGSTAEALRGGHDMAAKVIQVKGAIIPKET